MEALPRSDHISPEDPVRDLRIEYDGGGPDFSVARRISRWYSTARYTVLGFGTVLPGYKVLCLVSRVSLIAERSEVCHECPDFLPFPGHWDIIHISQGFLSFLGVPFFVATILPSLIPFLSLSVGDLLGQWRKKKERIFFSPLALCIYGMSTWECSPFIM